MSKLFQVYIMFILLVSPLSNPNSIVSITQSNTTSILIAKVSWATQLTLTDANIPHGWPLQGKITSPFGKRLSPFSSATTSTIPDTEFHYGVDIGVNEGTPVAATANGVVEYAGNERGGYGEVVFITHANGYTTVYGHNSRLLVVTGQYVSKGDIIALSGNTGHSTGPHLHYEVRYLGEPIDPEPFFHPFPQSPI